MKTQIGRIADILEREGRIHNFDAINSRLTIRLAMHIGVLRARGWEIRTKETPEKNTIYWLVAKPKLRQLSLTSLCRA